MIANTSVKWICTCDHVLLFSSDQVSSDLGIHVCEMYESLLKQHLQPIGCPGIKNVPRCPQCFFFFAHSEVIGWTQNSHQLHRTHYMSSIKGQLFLKK